MTIALEAERYPSAGLREGERQASPSTVSMSSVGQRWRTQCSQECPVSRVLQPRYLSLTGWDATAFPDMVIAKCQLCPLQVPGH